MQPAYASLATFRYYFRQRRTGSTRRKESVSGGPKKH